MPLRAGGPRSSLLPQPLELLRIEKLVRRFRPVAHLSVVRADCRRAVEMREDVTGGVRDHVRAVIAEVEARDAADADRLLAPQRLVEIFQIAADHLAALVAAVLVVAARAGADEGVMLEGIFHRLLQ